MRSADLITRLPIASLVAIALMSTGCKDKTPPEVAAEPPEPPPVAQQVLSRVSSDGPMELNVTDECSGRYTAPDYQPPTEIFPVDGRLETELVVRTVERCVPVWGRLPLLPDGDDATDDSDREGWVKTPLALRTYGYPEDPSKPIDPNCAPEDEDAGTCDSNLAWSAPGPTFVLEKGDVETRGGGTEFGMTLYNRLDPAGSGDECNDYDDGDNTTPPTSGDFPNCFHGDNDTNFHFHGFHISPQVPQDNVGVLIAPYDPEDPHGMDMGDMEAAHGDHATMVSGEFTYDLDPIPWNQAEGTHWYHAHKHGSTALQLLNGLSGTFIIHGDFDDWLYDHYGVDGRDEEQRRAFDKLLVVQQIEQNLPFDSDAENNNRPQYPLVNGQANPIIRMAPGEVQRWRFVGATMTVSAQLEVNFETEDPAAPKPTFKQIARDGVAFSPENYGAQPLLTEVEGAQGPGFELSPGYRIDLLVQAPEAAGRYFLTHEVLAGELDEAVLESIKARNLSILGELGLEGFEGSPLLTVVVEGEGEPEGFPAEDEWPELPSFLDDIQVPEGESPEQVLYSMGGASFGKTTVFTINGEQYDPACVEPGQTLILEKPVAWELQNDSPIAHPFHIHTNPFQLVELDGEALEYPVWMDTLSIPVLHEDGTTPGDALIYQEAHDYTGPFVQHCHILGHEDRGMMLNVQTVCVDPDSGIEYYGTPTPGTNECQTEHISALQPCQ